MLGGGEHVLLLVVRDNEGDDGLAFVETHADHPVGRTPHRTEDALGEAGALARIAEEHDVVAAVGDGHADERFALVERRGMMPLRRAFLKAESGVFLIVPRFVAITM